MKLLSRLGNFRSATSKEKIRIIAIFTFSILAIFGFAYNNLQNPNLLFTSAWFFDVVLLSWTNLLALPILLLSIPWIGKPKNWEPLKSTFQHFILSPLYWIWGAISFKLSIKILIMIDQMVTSFLRWLAN